MVCVLLKERQRGCEDWKGESERSDRRLTGGFCLGLMLAASVDDEQVSLVFLFILPLSIGNWPNNANPSRQKTSLRRSSSKSSWYFANSVATLNSKLALSPANTPSSELSCATYNLPKLCIAYEGFSYIINDSVCFLCICDRSYPRKLAFTYLSDLATEFTTTYSASQYLSSTLRPYAFVEFDTFIQRTKKTYQDSRASQNLDKLNDELKDVTKVMTKNIEDLLYRGDSLERMGEMSGRLREDSRKYRKAAVRINWELLIKQVSISPFMMANSRI